MSDSQDLIELEHVLRQLLKRIIAAWGKVDEGGFTSSQGFVLERLESEGPLKVSQIAEALCLTSGAITTLSDKLISAGYAIRKRTEEDRRVVYLEITPQGRAMLDKMRAHRKSIIEAHFGGLSHEDCQHLIRILGGILATVDKDRKD
ncbi:MarR family winged helix-turn-helix transcriptional regulator [Paenibacillus hamazuiensis]|uniref:MarR family winged helix-turn-helix transcriptional regulator n=1 Tax=Paenibacillus hamazuiensis TaxID=2936508 RepID=UPI00200C7E40|nr:MarR family transcriptional regulator [Paenibacillus hamazuiensis]